MTGRELIAAFETLAEAPDGVKRLRELVLQLAVRGKLVPQDPADEPASVLLERIAAEKARLVKAKEIRKPKVLPPMSDAEVPFEVPVGWAWAWLSEIGVIGSSRRVHKRDWRDEGVPFYRAREIVKLAKFGAVEADLFISPDLHRALAKSGLTPDANDVMITGVGTIGVPYVVRPDDNFYFKDASVLIFKNYFNADPHFLRVLFTTPYWNDTIHADSMGTTVHTLTIRRASIVAVPVPPLAEQKRIVTRVDELMGLLDTLEARRTAREATRVALRDAALAALRDADTPAAVEAAWARIAGRMDHLFTDPADVEPLRQTVLQLAVRGRLVPQDPADEPASVLLARIAAEKARLVKAKTIRKPKVLPPVTENEVPFEVPTGWVWTRAADLTGPISSGSTPPKQVFQDRFTGDNVPYLKVYNIRQQRIDFEYRSQFIDPTYHRTRMKRSVLVPGTVLLNIVGPPLGKTAIVPSSFPEWNCNQAIAFFRCLTGLMPRYLHLYFRSGEFLQHVTLVGTAGQDNLSVTKCKNLPIPLPPLPEQKRILSRVDEITALLDKLEQHFKAYKNAQEAFAAAVVHHLDA